MHTHLHNGWSARAAPMAAATERFIDELSMDVLVKSFNHAYGLDRCLASLARHVRKIRSIRVLDDGTPEKYLSEIQRRHPHVAIVRSPRHAEVSARLETHRAGDPPLAGEPPWAFWMSCVQAASPRFLLLEDTQWCVGDLDLGSLGQMMKSHTCALVRLRDDHPEPGTPLSSPGFLRLRPWYLKSPFHTLLFRALLSRWLDPRRRRAAQAEALSIRSGVFDRAFWLDAAADPASSEPAARAARWASRHRRASFARAAIPLIASTHSTPVVLHPQPRPDGFDLPLFHKLLNEYWFAGRFDACAGLPDDFPRDQIAAILDEAREPNCTVEKWAHWLDQFAENAAP